MAFNKKLYIECKKLTLWNLEHPSFLYEGNPKDWILGILSSCGEYVKRQQYEQAKAIKDAVTEYINKYLSENDKLDINTIIKEKYLYRQ